MWSYIQDARFPKVNPVFCSLICVFRRYVGCDGAGGVGVVATELHEYPSCDRKNCGFNLYKRRLIVKCLLLVTKTRIPSSQNKEAYVMKSETGALAASTVLKV